jgi:hypothetical protein
LIAQHNAVASGSVNLLNQCKIGIQEEFFYKATDALSRRESLNAFVALGTVVSVAPINVRLKRSINHALTDPPSFALFAAGIAGIATWGVKGSEVR